MNSRASLHCGMATVTGDIQEDQLVHTIPGHSHSEGKMEVGSFKDMHCIKALDTITVEGKMESGWFKDTHTYARGPRFSINKG